MQRLDKRRYAFCVQLSLCAFCSILSRICKIAGVLDRLNDLFVCLSHLEDISVLQHSSPAEAATYHHGPLSLTAQFIYTNNNHFFCTHLHLSSCGTAMLSCKISAVTSISKVANVTPLTANLTRWKPSNLTLCSKAFYNTSLYFRSYITINRSSFSSCITSYNIGSKFNPIRSRSIPAYSLAHSIHAHPPPFAIILSSFIRNFSNSPSDKPAQSYSSLGTAEEKALLFNTMNNGHESGSLGTKVDSNELYHSSLANSNSKGIDVSLPKTVVQSKVSLSVNPNPNPSSDAPSSLSQPPPTEVNPNPSKPEPNLSDSSPLMRGVLWFDNVYPMRAHFLDPRHLFATHEHENLMPEIMEETMKINGQSASNIDILAMIPRMKEGGVFVRFECTKTEAWKSAADVAEAVIVALKNHPRRAVLTPRSIHCHLVKGEPWLEDMASRFPSNRLKIELKGSSAVLSELTLEHLYGELRAFGVIYDLSLTPWGKEQPRTASVQFRHMHSAVGVRNCLHRYKLRVGEGEATMYMTYDSVLKTSVITDFFVKHPRIVVPLLGLLFALFTYLIFDPLREFNIKNKITKRFSWQELISRGPIPWLRSKYNEVKNSHLWDNFRGAQENSKVTSWNSRQADEERVNKWLHSIPDRVLFLTGPKGAGKQALVKKITADRKNVVKIDISHIIDRSDEDFVKGLAEELGFAPGFSFLNFIGNIMDVFTPGASKATTNTNAPQQVQKILEVTSNALEQIARNGQGKKMINTSTGEVIIRENKEKVKSFENAEAAVDHRPDRIQPQDPEQARAQFSAKNSNNNKEEKKEDISNSHNSKQENNGSTINKANNNVHSSEQNENVAAASGATHSNVVSTSNSLSGGTIMDELPLFVIDGFTPDNKDKHFNFMNELVAWAGEQTAQQRARFLFLTDSTLEESISKQLADVKMSEVVLSDASVESAMQFVAQSVGYEMDSDEQQECREAVQTIGGRYNDLLTLVRQIESGSRPAEAKEEILQQSMAGAKSFLFTQDKSFAWSRVQLWQTMLMLASAPIGAALYDDILFNIFLGEESGLKGLIRVDLLRLDNSTGIDFIRAGSPVYLEAFRRMANSPKLRPGLDLQVAKYYISSEQDKINKYEEELNKIAAVQSQLSAAGSRVYDVHFNDNSNNFLTDYSLNERRTFLLQLIQDSHEKVKKYDEIRRNCEKQIKQITVLQKDKPQNNTG
jgi:hypothetical protein